MRTFIAVLAVALALASGLAEAQAYRWVDKDGKVRYSDVPPTGAKTTTLKPPPAGAAPAPAAAGKDASAEDARKGPLTPAEQEQAYRERQLKVKEGQEKSAKEQAEADQRKLACDSAQEGLRGYERGGRIASINEKGETVFLDDDQRAARMEQMRKAAAESCK